jgi:hypothetical protein
VSDHPQPIPSRIRLALSVTLGLGLGWAAYLRRVGVGPQDFDQVWFAARAWLAGQNPYALIGPGRAFEWVFPLFYPLPAAIAMTPLTPFPAPWADATFFAIGAGCFAWALMRYGYPPLLGMVSVSMFGAVQSVQWSPLLGASFVLAPLGVFAVAKPTIGAALFVARPNRWMIAGGALLLAVAFASQPGWFTAWRSGFTPGLHFGAPVLQKGGFVALLGLLRWRRPEARLLVALACVPQTMLLYEALPLFLIPRTTGEVVVLLLASDAAQVVGAYVSGGAIDRAGAGLWLLSLPAALIVLRRPNEGPAPAWLEQRIAKVPRWLRGTAGGTAAGDAGTA